MEPLSFQVNLTDTETTGLLLYEAISQLVQFLLSTKSSRCGKKKKQFGQGNLQLYFSFISQGPPNNSVPIQTIKGALVFLKTNKKILQKKSMCFIVSPNLHVNIQLGGLMHHGFESFKKFLCLKAGSMTSTHIS